MSSTTMEKQQGMANGKQRTSCSGEKAWLASQYSHRFALL